ncbi:hypothetical protein QJQ45_023321, partial [Haematococcus lacustris]
ARDRSQRPRSVATRPLAEVESCLAPRQARVGTGPTTHDGLGGPQMSAISPETFDVNEDPSYGIMSRLEGNIWQLGGIPSPCQGLAVIHTQCVTASVTTDGTYSGGSPDPATC